jgi:hypothetical protein
MFKMILRSIMTGMLLIDPIMNQSMKHRIVRNSDLYLMTQAKLHYITMILYKMNSKSRFNRHMLKSWRLPL